MNRPKSITKQCLTSILIVDTSVPLFSSRPKCQEDLNYQSSSMLDHPCHHLTTLQLKCHLKPESLLSAWFRSRAEQPCLGHVMQHSYSILCILLDQVWRLLSRLVDIHPIWSYHYTSHHYFNRFLPLPLRQRCSRLCNRLHLA